MHLADAANYMASLPVHWGCGGESQTSTSFKDHGEIGIGNPCKP